MAKLTISDAARVAGVSRVTLHRYINAGKLHRTPDGAMDTAELLRAGFLLHPETLAPETPATPMVQEASPSPVTPTVAAETYALERMVKFLETELERARTRETVLLQVIQDMQHLVDQAQTQSHRLLEAPRAAQPPRTVPAKDDVFDPARHILGKLCPRGHAYQDTGQSLRDKKWDCVVCRRERKRVARK